MQLDFGFDEHEDPEDLRIQQELNEIYLDLMDKCPPMIEEPRIKNGPDWVWNPIKKVTIPVLNNVFKPLTINEINSELQLVSNELHPDRNFDIVYNFKDLV